jgi:hypothetical protein
MIFRNFEKSMDRKMKLLSVVALLYGAVVSYGQSTIGYEAGNAERNVFFNGLAVPDGNVAKIGFFTPGFDLTANADDLPALNANWTELAFTPFRAVFSPPNDGRFSDSASTANTAFDNKRISLWIFKTTDNAAPVPGFGNVAGYGIFSSTAANWVFPSQSGMPPLTTSVYSSEVNQAYHAGFDADPVNGHLYLTPVPEPSAFALVGLAFGALIAARKRVHARTRRTRK